MKSVFRVFITFLVIFVLVVTTPEPALSMAIESINYSSAGNDDNQESSETPTPTPSTPTAEATNELEPTTEETPAPESTPTPDLIETPENDSLDETIMLVDNPDLLVWTDKEYLVAGEQTILTIELSEAVVEDDLIIEVSEGLTPVDEDRAASFDSDENTLSAAGQPQTTIIWQSDPTSSGPYYFYVQVVDENGVVAEDMAALDQAVRGSATALGGAVNWEEKGISIIFPEGAVDQDVDLIVRQAYAHPIAPYNLSGHSVVLHAENSEGNEISSFDTDVSLAITYDPEEFAGNESVLFLRYYDEEVGDWLSVPSQRDVENHIVSAEISHFSEWDLEAGSWEASRLPTLDNFDSLGFSGAVTVDYPIDLPAGPGGFAPELNLSYNSSVVDGINLYTQAGWTGMGWSLEVGSIVRDQHGTADTTIDDSFRLTLSGMGGLLIQEETDPASNIVNYYVQNESFLRVQYYKAEKAWVVWDKSGTRYIFGGELDQNGVLISHNGSAAEYPSCDGEDRQSIWYWGIRQIIDQNSQKILVSWSQNIRYNVGVSCGGTTYSKALALDIKPTTITYSNDGYRVLFTTTSNRRDYHSDWHATDKVFYTQKNLDRIDIQKYEGGQWVTAWYYDLTYAQDLAATDPSYNNFIMPSYKWDFWWQDPVQWQKTLTLVSVEKCYSGGQCDPEYSFEYGDGLHITRAENGQGGRVDYVYDPEYEVTSSPLYKVGASNREYGVICGNQGADGTFGWTGNCSEYSSQWFLWLRTETPSQLAIGPNRTIPGSYYRYFTRLGYYGHGDNGDSYKAQIGFNSIVSDETERRDLLSDVFTKENNTFYLKSNPTQANRFFLARMMAYEDTLANPGETPCMQGYYCDGLAIFSAYVQPVITKYRVTQETITDLVSGDQYSYTYTYDEFATNDVAHSQNVQNTTAHCGIDTGDTWDDETICYERIYDDFRGHGSSTVTDPSGLTTINYYHQDDALAGRSSASLVVVSQFGDNFGNGLNPSQWAISLSGGSNDVGDVVRHYGDNALMLTEGEPTEWSNVIGNATTSPDGRSMIVQFMPQSGSEFNIGVQDSSNPNYLWRISGSDSGISAQYGDGNGLSTPQTLINSGAYEADQWYVAIFTLDHDDGYSIRVWKRVDPSINGFYAISAAICNFTSGMTWQFAGAVSNGTLYIDEYMEAYVYSLTLNNYVVETNPNSIVTDPPNYYRWAMGDFPGFNVYWAKLLSTESYIFEGGAAFQATKTIYAYDDSPQYGNVTGIREQEWVYGSGFVDVRQTNLDYYPADTTSSYIVNLPAEQTVYSCSGGDCTQDLLSISRTYYDSHPNYTDSPIRGQATLVRQGMDQDASTIYWADTEMSYDNWGNQISTTQYTGYGTGAITDPQGTVATLGAQTTTTTFDTALHTYPVNVTPALSSHQMTMTYDTFLGLPEAMTDPNGLVTLLCYDNRARLIGSVKGDSANPPTCGSQMEISISYHEATKSGVSWLPFWTEAKQLLVDYGEGYPDLDIRYRKFYDGIGRQIQTQTVGVDLDGFEDGSQSIVNDFFYNANGLPEYSSMPYNITTEWGYHTPPACTAGTCISSIYDALSREIEVQAPDGSVTQTTYGLDATERLRTVTVSDTLQNSTISWQDSWGQIVRMTPETGPWTEYDYDLTGQLIQVDQVNGTGIFASTYMAYDLGGRKLEINDPDMGVWTYAYDALGNLTSQADANLQTTNLCYDELNRLTGKYYGSGGDCSAPTNLDIAYYYDSYTAGIFSNYTGPTTNAVGQRTGMLDGSGQSIWSFDQRGNLVLEEKSVNTDTLTTEWAYSIGGLLEEMTYPEADGTTESIYYGYHPQGTVAKVSSSEIPSSPPLEPILSYCPLFLGGTATEALLMVPESASEVQSLELGYPVSEGSESSESIIGNTETVPLESPPLTMETMESTSTLNISITYDEAGRVVNRTYFSEGDGLQTNFEYFDWNEQVNTTPQGGLLSSSQTGTLADPDSLVSWSYLYDAVGNIASITDLVQAPAQVQNFSYDSIYRLTSANGSAGFGDAYSEAYTFDDSGRMDSMAGNTLNYSATRTGTCQTNTLTPATRSSITHAVSSKSGGNAYTYDCNGNAIARGDQTLIYDEENRLVEVQENSVTIAEYVYDGNGNRVKATVTGGGLTITTTFIGTFFEQTVTDDGSINTTSWKKYYSADAARLAMREDSDDPLFLVSDHLGSTSLVVDSSGQQAANQTYLPYGDVWGVSANDLPTSFTFTGQREAPETGLMYYVARFYDPEIGHFIQADTIIPSSGNPIGWNRYAYANYNPINYNDPSGHLALLAIAAIVVGVGLIAGAIDAAIQYNNTGEVDVAQSLTVAAIATGGAALGAGVLALTGVISVTAGATAVAATTTATTVGTAVMADGDPTNEVNAVLDTANSACGGDYCASEAQDLSNALARVVPSNPGEAYNHIINNQLHDHRWLEFGIDTLDKAWPHIESVVHNNVPYSSEFLGSSNEVYKQLIYGFSQIGNTIVRVGVEGISIPGENLFRVTTSYITQALH